MIGAALKSIASSVIRLYPLVTSQGAAFPLATYQILMVNPAHQMSGEEGLWDVDVQINVVSTTYEECDTLSLSLVSAFNRWSGTSGTENIIDIRHMGGPEDLFQEDAQVYGKAIDFKLFIRKIVT